MSEVFKEYLVKQKKLLKDVIMQMMIIIGCIILSVLVLMLGTRFIGALAPLVVAGIIAGAFLLFARFNKEYEYILTNNELDIDVIYNRSSRKRVITVDLKKIDSMASIKDKQYEHELNRPNCKVINASDNAHEANTYAIITQSDKYGACKILITPNDDLLDMLFRQAPNKVHRKRD